MYKVIDLLIQLVAKVKKKMLVFLLCKFYFYVYRILTRAKVSPVIIYFCTLNLNT